MARSDLVSWVTGPLARAALFRWRDRRPELLPGVLDHLRKAARPSCQGDRHLARNINKRVGTVIRIPPRRQLRAVDESNYDASVASL